MSQPTFFAHWAALAVVLVGIGLPSLGHGQAVESGLDEAVTRVVERHQEMLVLLDEANLAEATRRDRLVTAARRAYEARTNELSRLSGALLPSRRPDGPDGPEPTLDVTLRFVDSVENVVPDPLDRLAFSDLLDEIEDAYASDSRSAGVFGGNHPARLRLSEIASVLEGLRSDLDEEVALERGSNGPRDIGRPKWSDYLLRLRANRRIDEIVKQYLDDGLPPAARGGSIRGARPYGDSALFGYDLPKKSVVLTFDDGPHSRYTADILDILEERGLVAYFFTLGQKLGRIGKDGELIWTKASVHTRLSHHAGHVLANHSYSHSQMPKLSLDERQREIAETNELLEEITGKPIDLFRPPYGDTSRELTDEYAAAGMTSVLWNVDSLDWGDPVPESIASRVIETLEESGRGILLFHDIHKQTVSALPHILDELELRGYEVSTLDGLPSVPPKPISSLDVTRQSNPRAKASPRPTAYRSSWALIVGINEYQHWPRLKYAVNDARAIEQSLIQDFSFLPENVFTLTDREATREAIVDILGDTLSDPNRVHADDRVFVFFAGHGATRDLPSEKQLGYLVPVDADFDRYQTRSISMTQLQDFSESIPAKHIYFVMDSCYSGLALTRGRSPDPGDRYFEEVTSRVARQILTAGGADEAVADNGPRGHSIFTWTLLQGMQGLADLDGNHLITATELGAFSAPIVSKFSNQTPSFGNLVGSEGGEFVFRLEPENLSEVSHQMDQDALTMSREIAELQEELAEKLERNLRLHERLDEKRRANGRDEPDGPVEIPDDERIAQANRHHALGLQYFREKRYQQASEELARAISLNPDNPTIVNNYGFVLYRMGRHQESIRWLRRTMDLDPNRAVAYVNLADALYESGSQKEATPLYAKYLELWPETPRRENIEKRIGEP